MGTDQGTSLGDSACVAVRCQGVANRSVDLFVSLLEQAAQASDGTISVQEVRALSEAFKQAPGKLADFYQKTYTDCTETAVAQSQPEGIVRNPFRYLLMTQVCSGIVRNLPINRDRRSTEFSPRMLNAFVKGLERLMPRKFVMRANTRAAAIEARLRQSLGDKHYSWQAFCQDSESQRLLSESMAQLGETFKAFKQQSDRLITEVNSILGNVQVSNGLYVPAPPAIFGEQQSRSALKAMIEEVCNPPADRPPEQDCETEGLDARSRSLIKALYRQIA